MAVVSLNLNDLRELAREWIDTRIAESGDSQMETELAMECFLQFIRKRQLAMRGVDEDGESHYKGLKEVKTIKGQTQLSQKRETGNSPS